MIPYDNRAAGDYVKTPLAALCGRSRRGTGRPHFLFKVRGKTIAYCYIRKNACSAFKRLIVDFSEHADHCPEGRNPIDFMVRYHQEDSLDRLSRSDAAIFVYRDPIRRLTSLFTNKFIVRSGHEDIFADFRRATGRDPATASFRDFVSTYLADDPLSLDPHVWPQRSHLHRIRYTDAIFVGDLQNEMAGLIGRDLADKYFAAKTNASVGRHDDAVSDLSARPAEHLREDFLAKKVLPRHEQLAPVPLAEAIADIYADDVVLVDRLSKERARQRERQAA